MLGTATAQDRALQQADRGGQHHAQHGGHQQGRPDLHGVAVVGAGEQARAQAGLRPGMKVLDVAGGTADLTRLFLKEVGDTGTVVLTDINQHRALADDGVRQGLLFGAPTSASVQSSGASGNLALRSMGHAKAILVNVSTSNALSMLEGVRAGLEAGLQARRDLSSWRASGVVGCDACGSVKVEVTLVPSPLSAGVAE